MPFSQKKKKNSSYFLFYFLEIKKIVLVFMDGVYSAHLCKIVYFKKQTQLISLFYLGNFTDIFIALYQSYLPLISHHRLYLNQPGP